MTRNEPRTPRAFKQQVADLALVLATVTADRSIDFVDDTPAGFALTREQHDVGEMLGNLLENAFSWCKHKVSA